MSLCSDGLSSDQYFLVNFIMSNYLGPDVYYDNPRISASQRLAKGLPPYTLNHIGSSSLTVAQLQCLYSYVLRNAESGLLLHPYMIYMYLKGYLPLEPTGKFTQFTYFFPTNLHVQKIYSPSHEIVKGIVVIDDPPVAFISKEEFQRFRCLSRLNDLKIDRVVSLSPRPVQLKEIRGTEQDCLRNGEAVSNGIVSDQGFKLSADLGETCKQKKEEETVAGHAICITSKTSESQGMEHGSSRNGEAISNGSFSDKDFRSSADPGETCKRKKDEEAVSSHAIFGTSRTSESQGMEHGSSRNGEAVSNGVVSNKDFTSSADPGETCKRKKEEEAVACHAICVTSKTSESQGTEHDSSRNGEATFNGLVSDQDFRSSADPGETCKRKKEEEEIAGQAICVSSQTSESQGTEHGILRNEEAAFNGLFSDQDHNSSQHLQVTCKRKEAEKEPVADHSVCGISKTPERYRETYKRRRFKNPQTKATDKNGKTRIESEKTGEPTSMSLVPVAPPETKKCDAGQSGTATIGTLRPSTGAVDIGVNKVAYFFRVALPGVRKDEGEFSCEIESDGKVTLEVSRTGGKTMNRYSRVFKMHSPPEPFKLCFSLPGPVDPRLVSPNFTDGIFEAVIIKHNNSN